MSPLSSTALPRMAFMARIGAFVAERAIWAALAAILVASASARADGSLSRPTITAAGGAGGALTSVWFRVGIDGVGAELLGKQCLLAQFRGDLLVDPRVAEDRIEELDIRFSAADCARSGGLRGGRIRFAPGEAAVSRALDRALSLRVDALEREHAYLVPIKSLSPDLMVSLKAKAAAIGAKVARHVSETGDFYGLNVGSVEVEAAAILVKRSVLLRASLGLRADLSLGARADEGFTALSDVVLYNELSAAPDRNVSFYVRNSLRKSIDSSADNPEDYLFLGGAMLTF
jgi:hypothetical protein